MTDSEMTSENAAQTDEKINESVKHVFLKFIFHLS